MNNVASSVIIFFCFTESSYKSLYLNAWGVWVKKALCRLKLKISFLHLDMDVYEPTKFALEYLFSKVSKNGIILIDDYKNVKGATKATDSFLKKNSKLKIKNLDFNKRLSFFKK